MKKERSKIGMLVRLDYCLGCGSCKIACQQQNNLDVKQSYLDFEYRKPKEIDGKLRVTHAVFPEVDKCAECVENLEPGQRPLCTINCPMLCIEVGAPEELTKKMAEAPLGTWQLTY